MERLTPIFFFQGASLRKFHAFGGNQAGAAKTRKASYTNDRSRTFSECRWGKLLIYPKPSEPHHFFCLAVFFFLRCARGIDWIGCSPGVATFNFFVFPHDSVFFFQGEVSRRALQVRTEPSANKKKVYLYRGMRMRTTLASLS